MEKHKLDTAIKEIARIYFIALQQLKSPKLSSGEEDPFSPFYKYYVDVEKTFVRLDSKEKEIINKEYFYDAYKDWWKRVYKAKEFVRIKYLAVSHFLEVFNEIH